MIGYCSPRGDRYEGLGFQQVIHNPGRHVWVPVSVLGLVHFYPVGNMGIDPFLLVRVRDCAGVTSASRGEIHNQNARLLVDRAVNHAGMDFPIHMLAPPRVFRPRGRW